MTVTISKIWQWKSWQGLPYLSCTLLEDWQHGFFTREFFPRSPAALTEILDPISSVYHLNQVHGNDVVLPSQGIKEADGLISEKPQQALWVASADCTPILLADVESKKVGAVHAGWRGTSQGIVKKAIARFLEAGSYLENLRIALGPAISGKVYEVSEAVAAMVCKTIVPELPFEEEIELLSFAWELPDTPLIEDPNPGKVCIDIPKVNCLQLQQLGIKPPQMAIAPFCTYQHQESFFSYRRTQEKKVQWSGIIS